MIRRIEEHCAGESVVEDVMSGCVKNGESVSARDDVEAYLAVTDNYTKEEGQRELRV